MIICKRLWWWRGFEFGGGYEGCTIGCQFWWLNSTVSPDRSHSDAPGGAECSGPSEGLPLPNPNLSLVDGAVADVKIAVCCPGSGLSRHQFSSGGFGSGHAGCCAIVVRRSDASILASNLANDATTCSNASVGEFIARDDADCASPPTIAPAARSSRTISASSKLSPKHWRDDDKLRELIRRIRNAVYEVEDIIDAYVTQSAENKAKSYFSKAFQGTPKTVSIANKVEAVLQKIDEIYKDKQNIIDFANITV
ncbi:hypothetical protein SASPL_129182 [Salvia splendens]|uniref:Rx N-terminal domain-containing protein n=1 Tax=Salvia splendens TaxID=180675 RepID=A0A8X8XFK6_SALSN|nr:hypothetical protein SASPL_129182 [Salvia splendens]